MRNTREMAALSSSVFRRLQNSWRGTRVFRSDTATKTRCFFLFKAHHSLHPAAGPRVSTLRSMYTDTRKNMMLTKDTRVICQGFTGKQVITTDKIVKIMRDKLLTCRAHFTVNRL